MRTLRLLVASLIVGAAIGWTVVTQGRADTGARTALLIGNAAYPDDDAPLASPVGDAHALAEALKRRGFSADVVENLKARAAGATLDRFFGTIQPNAIAVVFFAGHAIQVGGKNYLIPVDARIWNDADVLRDGISVDKLLAESLRRGATAVALILDASRRNPFEHRYRHIPGGLAAASAAPGTISFYSAPPGTILKEDDQSATTSVFATELVKQIGTAAIDVEQTFAAARDAVVRQTRNQRTPVLVSGLDAPFAFDSAVTAASPPVKPSPPPPPAVPEPQFATAEADPAPMAAPPPVPAPSVSPKPVPPKAEPVPPKTAALPTEPMDVPPPDLPAEPTLAEPPPPEPERTPFSASEAKRKIALDNRIQKDEGDEPAFFERGRLLAAHGDYRLALSDFDRSISLNPNNPDTLNNRCWTRAMVNQLDTAMDDCNEALKLRPNFADAHDSRGLVLLKMGAPRAAMIDYDAALKENPKHGSALYGRGLAKLRLGNNDDADRDFTNASTLAPGIDRDYARYGLK